MDLVFILDRSWSLRSPDNFQKELDFVSQVVSVLDFENSRVSVITFSDDADLNIRFSDYYTLADFQRAVRALPWVGGNTYTHKAIELMMTEENQRSRDRAGITSIGVIITDGGSTDPYKLEDVVRQVHDKRIEMYAIGKSSTIFNLLILELILIMKKWNQNLKKFQCIESDEIFHCNKKWSENLLQFCYTWNLIQNVKHAYFNFKDAIWA